MSKLTSTLRSSTGRTEPLNASSGSRKSSAARASGASMHSAASSAGAATPAQVFHAIRFTATPARLIADDPSTVVAAGGSGLLEETPPRQHQCQVVAAEGIGRQHRQ